MVPYMIPRWYLQSAKMVPKGYLQVPWGYLQVPTVTYKVPTGTYSTHWAQFVPLMDTSSIVVRHELCKRSRGCKDLIILIRKWLTIMLVCGFRVRAKHRKKCRLPSTHVRYGELMRSCVTVYGMVRYGTVRYCTVPYRTGLYIYRMVRYRTENLEIMERGEPDPN
jgi:hypothetical protein